ncbi:Protein HSP-17 a [Aphelenchoides avenae]|nr:Protein HSP-17 a [Aphelenchus avenae]
MESHHFGEGVGPAQSDSAEEVHVQIDVSHFRPEDLKVNVVDDWIVIEGRHEQKADKYGQIERNFVRKVKLPSGVKPEDVTSDLSVDGILTVQAEKPRPQEDSRVRHIPIRSKH